jgi:hypothetical protein
MRVTADRRPPTADQRLAVIGELHPYKMYALGVVATYEPVSRRPSETT